MHKPKAARWQCLQAMSSGRGAKVPALNLVFPFSVSYFKRGLSRINATGKGFQIPLLPIFYLIRLYLSSQAYRLTIDAS